MQTLHLRFRALRAISSGQSPSRWQTRSMQRASKWETASPLPNPLGPTLAVGSRPAARPPDRIQCPVAGAGVPGVPRLRAARKVRHEPVLPCRVCRWQTADVSHQSPAHHTAGEIDETHRQAHASTILRMASGGPSFPLRPQRSGASGAPPVQQRNAPPERFQEAASPSGEKTADPVSHVEAWAGVRNGVRDDRSLRPRG